MAKISSLDVPYSYVEERYGGTVYVEVTVGVDVALRAGVGVGEVVFPLMVYEDDFLPYESLAVIWNM